MMLLPGFGCFPGGAPQSSNTTPTTSNPPPATPANSNSHSAADDTTTLVATKNADEIKAIKSDYDALAKKVGDLEDRLNAVPKPTEPKDLAPLEQKVNTLAKLSETVNPLPEKIEKLSERADASDKEIDRLRSEIADLRKGLVTQPEPKPTLEPPKLAADADLNAAIALFQQRRYANALAAFQNLESSSPDDARVWYYAALANGLTTGKWDGETANLINRGIEREKAGSPAASVIDSAFTGLTKATGKDWLAGYRQRAK
jgi:tetratricopeptide (TPR) repeat protein